MSKQKFSLAFSPCPNDTFIFDALVNGKMDTGNFSFDVHLADVQTLNEWAMEGRMDISKISYGVLPKVQSQYQVLNSGSALGMGVGPLLIGKELPKQPMEALRIAIPGENTTAHMLFSLAYPKAQIKKFLVFHQIEEAVLSGEVDAGVIIHENRFTYQEKGLVLIKDLGAFWETQCQLPIPLGGIVVKRSIDPLVMQQLDTLIAKSLEISYAAYPILSHYVKANAQEMSEEVMRQHIQLYVNNYTKNLSKQGQRAIIKMMEVYHQIHENEKPNRSHFTEQDHWDPLAEKGTLFCKALD